jgi:hypothetical protein
MRPSSTLASMNHGCLQISWAACPRWATSASADLVDVVEQVGGGWAVLLIDVQGSGSGGRRLAGALMHFARQQLAAGVDPVTAVTAVHQHLVALRQGKVGASIHVCAFNTEASEFLAVGFGALQLGRFDGGAWAFDDVHATPAGFAEKSPPQSVRVDLCQTSEVVLANDGIAHTSSELASLLESSAVDAQAVLGAAIRRDTGRPRADMAVVTVRRVSAPEQQRVISASFSIPAVPKWSDR